MFRLNTRATFELSLGPEYYEHVVFSHASLLIHHHLDHPPTTHTQLAESGFHALRAELDAMRAANEALRQQLDREGREQRDKVRVGLRAAELRAAVYAVMCARVKNLRAMAVMV
jgi:hypothetical protein